MDLAGLGRWLSRFESNAAQGTIEPLCLFTKFTFKNWPNVVM